jgi:hypothetical protein
MAGKSDIGRNLRNAQKKRDKDKEDREKSAQKRQRQNEQRQAESEERIGSRQPRKFTRPSDESSEGNRYSYKPKTPAKTTPDESSESKRYSYKPKTPDRTSESERFSYKPKEQDRTSEANRYSYKPQDDSDDDDDDDKPREWREPTQPAPRVLYDLAPAPSARDAVSLTSEPVDTGSSRFDTTSITPTTITSPTLRDWRGPVEGPRTREEAQGGGMGPQLPGVGRGLGMMDFTSNIMNVADRWGLGQQPQPQEPPQERRALSLRDYPQGDIGLNGPLAERLGQDIGRLGQGLGDLWRNYGQAGLTPQQGAGLGNPSAIPDNFKPRTYYGGERERLARQAIGARFEAEKQAGSNKGFDAALDAAKPLADALSGDLYVNTFTVPGTGYNIGQLASAFGSALNQVANPLNPNFRAKKGVEQFGNVNGGQEFLRIFNQELAQSDQAWQQFENLPDAARRNAQIGMAQNLWSGGSRQTAAMDEILGQDKAIADIDKQIEELEAKRATTPAAEQPALSLTLAELGRQRNEIASQSPIEIAQKHTNPWAEFMGGVVFDPTNVMGPISGALGLTPEAFRAARQGKRLADLNAKTPAQAAEYIQSFVDKAKPLVDAVMGGETMKVTPQGWWQRVNPLARRTPETMAHLTVDNLTRQAVTLIGGITDKETAKEVLSMWALDPAALVRGIGDPENVQRFGAAALEASPEMRATLGLIGKQIGELPILQGTGNFDPAALVGAVDNLAYSAARRAYGLDAITEMPVGATRAIVKPQGKDGAVVQYLDNNKKVVGQTDVMTPYEAELKVKQITEAGKSGGNVAGRLIGGAANVQRAILSDIWLNMRPGHWVRNALAATATLTGDKLYTLEKLSDNRTYLSNKSGGMLDVATPNGERGLGQAAGRHWSRKYKEKNNPLAALSEAGSRIWTGQTAIADRIPFGEEAFRLRAFKQGFQRFFDPNWTQTVTRQFVPALQQLGIPEELAQNIASIATQQGIRGNKVDVVSAIRQAVNGAVIPTDLKKLGVEPTAFTPNTWAAVDNALTQYQPGQESEALAAIQDAVRKEAEDYFKLLNQAPQQAGRFVHTARDAQQDGAELIEMATRGGMSREEAGQYVNGIIQQGAQQWDTFIREATTNTDPAVFNIAIDTWAQVQKLRDAARQQVDLLGRAASQTNNSAAWAEKWAETRRIYDELVPQEAAIFDQGRIAMAGGQPPAPIYDYWDLIAQHQKYDEQAVRASRDAGYGLNKMADQPELAERVINANRQYTDQSFGNALVTLRQFPSQEGFDIIANARQLADSMGKQAAGQRAEWRDLAEAGQMTWTDFYQKRNTLWNDLADNVAVMYNVARRDIVLNALAKDTASGLRWTDDFAGGEFQLLRPLGNNKWLAKNLEDGSTHTFTSAAPSKGATASEPQVPANVLQDWQRVVGNHDEIVEQTLKETTTYHGTSAPIDELRPAYDAGSIDNLYGPGFYTTADPNIAVGYTKKGGGEAPTLYQVQWDGQAPPKLIDLDKPVDQLPGGVRGNLRRAAGDEDIAGMTGREALDIVRGRWETGTGNVDDINDALNGLSQEFSRLGYDGYTYVGGANTGSPAHQVTQYFDATRVKLKKAALPEGAQQAVAQTPTSAVGSEGGVPGIWRTAEGDQQVRIVRSSGQNVEGTETFRVQLPDGAIYDANKDELYRLFANNKLRKLTDNDLTQELQQTLDMVDTGSIEDARKALRSEWDKGASAVWKLPKLDTLVARYSRGGVVRLPDKGIKGLEDLYGATVAGRRIEGQADVERFLQEYVNLRKQADTMGRRAQDTQAQYQRAQRAMEDYTIPKSGTGFNPLGMADDAGKDARQVVGQVDPTFTPTVGDVAYYQASRIQDALKTIQANLPAILKGQPNTLTQAQRLRVIDEAAKLGAVFDNVLDSAMRSGQGAADFAMLNFRDRRNMDTVLGAVLPYHYFWTRSAKNWAWRTATKPSIANFYAESKRAIDTENEQSDLPIHLRGKVQNPLNQYGIGPEYIVNPLNYALPFTMYQGSDFVDPEEAPKGSMEHALLLAQKYAPGIMPAYDVLLRRWQEGKFEPKNLGDYVPQYRAGGYAYQAVTGKTSPQGPLGWGDQWDMGRVGKQIGLQVLAGEAPPGASKYARDVGFQLLHDVPALPEQPAEAQAIWEAAARKSGISRLWAVAGAYALGLPMYEYTPEEAQLRTMQDERRGLGYGPNTNPYGSREAQQQFDEQTNDVVDWSYNSLYPGNEDREVRPGASAAFGELQDERGAMFDARQEKRDAYLTENFDATREELNEATGDEAFWDELELLDEKYPSAAIPESSGQPPKGMNPQERARWELERILKLTERGEPERPDKDADVATKQAYYAALAEFKKGQYDSLEVAADQLMQLDETEFPGITQWRKQFVDMAKGQYASELARRYDSRYASAIENEWGDWESLRSEMTRAQRAEAEARLQAEFTPEEFAAWKEYQALGSETEEAKAARKAIGEKFPSVYQMNTLAYSPEDYNATTAQFGDGWVDTMQDFPKHPGDGATDAQKQAYYDAIDAYERKNPQAIGLTAWVRGRTLPEGMPEGYLYPNKYGEDYKEATRLWGEDIFQVSANAPDYDDGKEKYFAYMEAHPELYEFWEWQKELKEMSPEDVARIFPSERDTDTETERIDPDTYLGARPYGSDRLPIGLEDGPLNIQPRAGEEVPIWPNERGPEYIPPGMSAESRAGGDDGRPVVTGGPTDEPIQLGDPADPLFERDRLWGKDVEAPDAERGGLSATGRSTEDYLSTSESWAKAQASRAKFAKSQAEWNDRKSRVATDFGDAAVATWDAYFDLPKGDARKQYMKDHPEMKLYNVAAFNPDEYAAAKELFAQEDLMSWVNVPAWDGTEETDDLRRQYYQEHPTAFVVHSWMNGRPSERDDDKGYDEEKGTSFFDFGKDYALAQEKFGDDIWQLVAQYKALPDDKKARAQFYDANPSFEEWNDWCMAGCLKMSTVLSTPVNAAGRGMIR